MTNENGGVISQPSGKPADPEVTTEKYGLEAGLWSIFASKDAAGAEKPGKGAQAKQLLAQYGSAYLITSISFALVSFAACYALVSSGAVAFPASPCSAAPCLTPLMIHCSCPCDSMLFSERSMQCSP